MLIQRIYKHFNIHNNNSNNNKKKENVLNDERKSQPCKNRFPITNRTSHKIYFSFQRKRKQDFYDT